MRAFLEESGLDGLLMVGESICNADMFYLSRFLAQDSFTLLLGEHVTLLVSSMEVGRALKESSADEVVSTSRYGIMERLLSGASPGEAYHQVLVEFLRDQGMRRIGVPFRFPAGAYQRLSRDFPVTVLEESPVARWRSVKTAQEMDAIRQVQRACERAIGRAVELIAAARVRGDLLISGDSPLTAEQVRTCIEACLLEDGCESADTIVAGGDAAVDPHARGSGPLPAGSPIVIDVSPRSKTSRYYAD
ncbi:MAG: aminopeptidase P family protein, partial [Methanothrix sp.]|nr:aminopeptidase P family protein [Methanothrix sp.]